MKPTTVMIADQAKRLYEESQRAETTELRQRVAYELSEILRWTCENTADWPTPLEALDAIVARIRKGE